ncbi:2-O-methyltransferase NoeI [Planctomycetes bacterium Pan216]|uniref:2-O-methyltransferase NoeI n=1 Tax=Kolteria novifilia TaxID=2527975 RepID=A0A518B9A1_9BACT|nr:2-O-methyltransferase NoeI [Planctomycetes bacterium Pan216]
MIRPTTEGVLQRIRKLFDRDPDRFLESCKGVIHVGANAGQEREAYQALGLRVLWVEPIPFVFEQLTANIETFSRQQAVQALITDLDGESYQFNIANNNGASSSILDFKDHKDIWPEVTYTDAITLTSRTLPTVLSEHHIDPSGYDALIMDTQGSELLVLEGAAPILRNFKYIKTEVADFESYAECCQLTDIDRFLRQHRFKPFSRHEFARHQDGGIYWDVTYKRRW